MGSTYDYRLQDILYRVCGSTARSSESASSLVLGKYNHVRTAYVLDVDQWDVTWQDGIDVYNEWSPKATGDAGSGSAHGSEVMSGCSSLMIRTKTYPSIRAMGMMVIGAWVRKLRYWGRDHFGCSLVSLFTSSLLMGFCPSTNGVQTGCYHLTLRWSFLVCRIQWMVTLRGTDRKRDLWFRISRYAAWFENTSFPLHSSSLVRCMQPGRCTHEEGDNVTAARDPVPGNAHSIQSACHKPPIWSSKLTHTSTITHIDISNCIPCDHLCAYEAKPKLTCPYPFSDHWLLQIVLTLFLREMSDVARYRQSWCKLHFIC
jgi:hypothetical protein